MTSDSACVAGVLLEVRKQPLQRLLVVLMLLALDDDLLATVDELVAALFGEVFLSEEFFTTVPVVVSTIFVLLRNTVVDVVL
jgi:hypothetical protein